jgi:hypothetical protein
VAADSEVVFRTAAVFVADVTLAHIASQDDDFLGRMKYACFTKTHVSPYSSSRGAAGL